MTLRFEEEEKCFEGEDDVYWKKIRNLLKIEINLEENLVERKKSG